MNNNGTESRERERELSELRKLVEEQKSQLKKLTSGGFMAAKLHNELAEIPADQQDNDEIRDGYQLKFVGKDYAKLQAGLKTETIITPDTAHNSKPENANSENVFITGDNLDALKHLKNAYSGKVDVIYIDPPYNTGSDGFIYADNFKFSDDDLREKLGLSADEISRVRALNGKSSHSAWLTFMLPRLMIAKRLLSDTGVIFISIDENEQAQLKMLCDEVFNEQNFVGTMIHKRSKGGGMAKNFVNSHDYVHVYAKNISNIDIKQPKIVQSKVVEINGEKFLINNDLYRRKFGGKIDKTAPHRDFFYEEILEAKGQEEKDFIDKQLKSGMYFLQKHSSGNHLVARYEKLSESFSKVFPIIEILSEKGVLDLSNLNLGNYFSYPKPVDFVKFLIQIQTISSKDSLVLDFFAGSGTTADAVMQLNKEDGGNRKYILVQLPEKVSKNSEAEKAGYKTIDQISRERIIRAATKIGDKSGFKHFRLTTPNNENALLKLEEFDPNAIVAFPEDMTTTFDGGEKAILQTWLIDDGFEFNQTSKIVEFAGYQAHYIEQRLYLISTGWSSEATRELLNAIGKNKLAVQSIVIFPYSFAFNELNELKINLRTAFEKSNKIELLERY